MFAFLLCTVLATASARIYCPSLDGLQFEKCGRESCYNPLKSRYAVSDRINLLLTSSSCSNNGTIIDLPVFTGPVVLQAYNTEAPWHLQYIQAAGRAFHMGGSNAAYCPSNVPGTLCTNQTVLYGSGLAVYIPGGQQMYIDKSGALRFTGAHSMAKPDLLYDFGGVVLSNGAYLGMNSSGWLACSHAGAETPQIHSALVPPMSKDINSTCTGLYLKVNNQPAGKPSPLSVFADHH